MSSREHSKAKRLLHDLVITEQPQPEFYKDEGGKGNVLRVEVSVPAEYELTESIPLHLVLHYESGARVEEEDQKILVVMNQPTEGFWLTPEAQVICFEFRLEKVSRRKDGQKFAVLVEVDDDALKTENLSLSKPIGGVLSSAVLVMSKRKKEDRIVSRRPRSGSDAKERDLQSDKMKTAVERNSYRIYQVEQQLKLEKKRSLQLESELRKMRDQFDQFVKDYERRTKAETCAQQQRSVPDWGTVSVFVHAGNGQAQVAHRNATNDSTKPIYPSVMPNRSLSGSIAMGDSEEPITSSDALMARRLSSIGRAASSESFTAGGYGGSASPGGTRFSMPPGSDPQALSYPVENTMYPAGWQQPPRTVIQQMRHPLDGITGLNGRSGSPRSSSSLQVPPLAGVSVIQPGAGSATNGNGNGKSASKSGSQGGIKRTRQRRGHVTTPGGSASGTLRGQSADSVSSTTARQRSNSDGVTVQRSAKRVKAQPGIAPKGGEYAAMSWTEGAQSDPPVDSPALRPVEADLQPTDLLDSMEENEEFLLDAC